MTITLEVTPEAWESLAAQAAARGVSLEDFLRTLVTTQAAAMPPDTTQAATQIADPDQAIDDLFDLAPIPPEVGEGAAARRNWYR